MFYSHNWSSLFRYHVHYLPVATPLTFVLGRCVAHPPIPVFLTAPMLHIGSQNCWDTTMTSWCAVRAEIWAIETEGDIYATI